MKSGSVGPTNYRRFELTNVVYLYNDVVNTELPPNVDVTPASVNWVRKNDKMERFSSERQLLKIFPEKEKLKLKDREDLIKLDIYCNELLK
jgi:hypothetical protein